MIHASIQHSNLTPQSSAIRTMLRGVVVALLATAAAAAPAAQCESFTQVAGGPVAIHAEPALAWLYALPADCPKACTICSAGCLFCTTSGYVGAGVPDPELPYSTTSSVRPSLTIFSIDPAAATHCLTGHLPVLRSYSQPG